MILKTWFAGRKQARMPACYSGLPNGFFTGKREKEQTCSVELKMPKLLLGKIVVILLSALVFYFGIAGLKSGEIRSRGYKFHCDENPLGYWFSVLTSVAGSVAIVYLMLTR